MNLNSLGSIILLLLVVDLFSGLLLGLLGEVAGLSTTVRSGWIGIVVGLVAAFLISRKAASK